MQYNSIKSYEAQLKDIDMPFKRFHLLFSLQGSPIFIALLFFTFFSIIPYYLFLLCGKNFEYGKIYQNEIEKISALKIFPEFKITLFIVITSDKGIPIVIIEKRNIE